MRVRHPRTEHGSAQLGDRIYLIGGYGWSNSGRTNNVEGILKDAGGDDEEEEEVQDVKESEKIAPVEDYPLNCTGVSCGVISISPRLLMSSCTTGAVERKLSPPPESHTAVEEAEVSVDN